MSFAEYSIIEYNPSSRIDGCGLYAKGLRMRARISPEPALLGFLLDGPMHGYDLYKLVNHQLGAVWRLGMSQMYAIFNLYAAQGWLRTRTQVQGARPSKKIMELTPVGRKAFKAWLDQPARGLREFRIDFFLRLYFARAAGVGPSKRLIDRQIATSQKELETLRLRETAGSDGENDLDRLTRSFRTQQLTTILKWLENNRANLIQAKSSLQLASVRKVRRSKKHIERVP